MILEENLRNERRWGGRRDALEDDQHVKKDDLYVGQITCSQDALDKVGDSVKPPRIVIIGKY